MAKLPYITSKDQVAPKDHAVFDSIVASRGAVQGPFTMFLHSPELAGRVAHVGAYVRFEGSLDMRVRVLAAMTVAREFEAMYVWGAQTGGARRLGVPESTITAIRENHSRGIPPEDAQIIEFTRQLLRKHRNDDATATGDAETVRQRRIHPADRRDRLLQHALHDSERMRTGGCAGRRGAAGLAWHRSDRRPPVTASTLSPPHPVIARSEATRQSPTITAVLAGDCFVAALLAMTGDPQTARQLSDEKAITNAANV